MRKLRSEAPKSGSTSEASLSTLSLEADGRKLGKETKAEEGCDLGTILSPNPFQSAHYLELLQLVKLRFGIQKRTGVPA